MDFMGRFPMSYNNLYIFVVVDYVSKWVEVVPTPTNDAKVVIKFLKKNIFARFGIPKALVTIILIFVISRLRVSCRNMVSTIKCQQNTILKLVIRLKFPLGK